MYTLLVNLYHIYSPAGQNSYNYVHLFITIVYFIYFINMFVNILYRQHHNLSPLGPCLELSSETERVWKIEIFLKGKENKRGVVRIKFQLRPRLQLYSTYG